MTEHNDAAELHELKKSITDELNGSRKPIQYRARICYVPASMLRSVLKFLPNVATNNDPEQTLAAHLLKELKPECGCAVCAVLREWFDETFKEQS